MEYPLEEQPSQLGALGGPHTVMPEAGLAVNPVRACRDPAASLP